MWGVFWYLEPFRRGSRLTSIRYWQTDRRTVKHYGRQCRATLRYKGDGSVLSYCRHRAFCNGTNKSVGTSHFCSVDTSTSSAIEVFGDIGLYKSTLYLLNLSQHHNVAYNITTAYLPVPQCEIRNLWTWWGTVVWKCGTEHPTSCLQRAGRAETVSQRRTRAERRRTAARSRTIQSPTMHHGHNEICLQTIQETQQEMR